MRLRLRRGFTLVELLVAVVLVDLGLLALVTGTAVLARRQNELRARATATRYAANRLQMLAAVPCAPASGSTALARGFAESWWSEARANHTHELRDSVVYVVQGQERSVVLRTGLVC